jgi:uncharacterized protein (DUF433 family)
MSTRIIDRGRGPEIEGTRITVYDVIDYWKEGWRYEQIAGLFRLPPNDIQAAIQYIEEHHDDVMNEYRNLLKHTQDFRYSSEVEEKLSRNRRKLQTKLAEIRSRRLNEVNNASDHG